MYDCDVLIVGAGPVGVTLALELALRKILFRIVDQVAERSDKSRALVIQPRTLELLSRHGHAQSLVDIGRPIRGVNVFVNHRRATTIGIEDAITGDSEFPFPLGISQADTERFLDDCLASYGTSVERPITAKSITQDGNGVTTKLEHRDGREETVRSKYVVGCDGAHSFVRHAAANLNFNGAEYNQDFLLCDAHLRNTSLPLDSFSMLLGDGTLLFFPMGGDRIRLVSAGQLISGDEELTLARFQSYLEKFAPPGHGTLTDSTWLARFRLHHRSVNSYRDGRLFVAGDAAHIHSPVGGQGMNTGIQDAVNLGWKLSAVLQGRTADPEALLNSYDAERRRVGEHLVQTTDQAFQFAANTNWLFLRMRNFVFSWLLPWVMPWVLQGARRERFYNFLTEFGVTYRKGPIVGAATGFNGPVGRGDRVPDGKLKAARIEAQVTVQGLCGGGSYHLLLFGGTEAGEGALLADELRAAREKVAGAMKDEVEARFVFSEANLPKEAELPDGSYVDSEGKVHAQYGFSGPGYVLVRPDLYVAHIGPLAQLDELVEFVKRL